MDDAVIKGWAIVDLFGHTRLAGHVRTLALGNQMLLRLTVPETRNGPSYTTDIGINAVYRISYVTEAIARQEAETVYDDVVAFYAPKTLPAAAYEDDEFSHDDNDDDIPL